MNEYELGWLWDALEGAFIDTSMYDRQCEADIEAAVERIAANMAARKGHPMTTVWRCAWQEKTDAAQNGVDHNTEEAADAFSLEVAKRGFRAVVYPVEVQP